MSLSLAQGPGAPPVPDNQGPYPTCTYHSFAKAVVNGCEHGKFTSGKKVDLSQSSVAAVLINEFKDLSAKWPTEFNGRVAIFQDNYGFQHKTIFQVSKIDSRDWKLELTDENQLKNEYLVTYRPPNSCLHCVYLEKYSEPDQILHCQNSWNGTEDRPQIKLSSMENLFKISFTCDIQGGPFPPTNDPSSGEYYLGVFFMVLMLLVLFYDSYSHQPKHSPA